MLTPSSVRITRPAVPQIVMTSRLLQQLPDGVRALLAALDIMIMRLQFDGRLGRVGHRVRATAASEGPTGPPRV